MKAFQDNSPDYLSAQHVLDVSMLLPICWCIFVHHKYVYVLQRLISLWEKPVVKDGPTTND